MELYDVWVIDRPKDQKLLSQLFICLLFHDERAFDRFNGKLGLFTNGCLIGDAHSTKAATVQSPREGIYESDVFAGDCFEDILTLMAEFSKHFLRSHRQFPRMQVFTI